MYLGRNTTAGPQLYVGFDNAVDGVVVYCFLYVRVSGGPGTPVRLYRQRD